MGGYAKRIRCIRPSLTADTGVLPQKGTGQHVTGLSEVIAGLFPTEEIP